MMTTPRTRAWAATAVGVLMLVIAAVYAAEPAHSLPAFFPGHVGAHSSEYGHHHVKHAIAAVAVGLCLFAYAWFATGPAGTAARERTT